MTWSFLPTALISVGWRCDGSRPCLFWPLLDHSLALLSRVHSSELMTSGYATLYHTLPHCCLNLSSSSLQGSASWVTDTSLNTGPVLLISGATQMTSLSGFMWPCCGPHMTSLRDLSLHSASTIHWMSTSQITATCPSSQFQASLSSSFALFLPCSFLWYLDSNS